LNAVPRSGRGAAPAGLAAHPASAVLSLNGAAMELVKAVRAEKGQEIGIPGARPVPVPPPAVYPAFSPAAMGQPSAPVVAASAAPLNGVVTVSVPPSTVHLLPVFPAIAPAQTASPTSGDPGVALKVVPRAAVPTPLAPRAVALKGAGALKEAGALMADVLVLAAAPRLAGSPPSR
jgi:hypothetical protein